MKLYVANGSPNARKVMAVLDHLGLTAELIYLDFFKGELKSPAYLAINPTGRVPALDDDGFVVWESNAINKYLCSKRPGNRLYPADPRRQAEIDRWLSWELAHFNQQLGILSFQTVAMPRFLDQPTNAPVAEWSARHLRRHAEDLERHLQGRRFMVGDDITLADYAVVHIEFFKDMMPFDWSPYPGVNAYFDRMRAAALGQDRRAARPGRAGAGGCARLRGVSAPLPQGRPPGPRSSCYPEASLIRRAARPGRAGAGGCARLRGVSTPLPQGRPPGPRSSCYPEASLIRRRRLSWRCRHGEPEPQV